MRIFRSYHPWIAATCLALVLGVGPALACATAPPISTPNSGVSTAVSTVVVPPAGTPVPTTGPSATPTPLLGTVRNISMADNGHTIHLRAGQRAVLHLREGLIWQVRIDQPAVFSRVIGVIAPHGSQGLFQSRRPGQTILVAAGNFACRMAHPACMVPTFLFRARIVVQ